MYKIAGALAAQGASLNEVYEVAEWASKNIGTIGVGLEHCHVLSIFSRHAFTFIRLTEMTGPWNRYRRNIPRG